jgi:aminopeptidase N
LTTITIVTTARRRIMPSYLDYLPEDGNFTEDDLWEAIAEANGLDVSEIMDGDLVDYL